jgi:hypothetical protein
LNWGENPYVFCFFLFSLCGWTPCVIHSDWFVGLPARSYNIANELGMGRLNAISLLAERVACYVKNTKGMVKYNNSIHESFNHLGLGSPNQ